MLSSGSANIVLNCNLPIFVLRMFLKVIPNSAISQKYVQVVVEVFINMTAQQHSQDVLSHNCHIVILLKVCIKLTSTHANSSEFYLHFSLRPRVPADLSQ